MVSKEVAIGSEYVSNGSQTLSKGAVEQAGAVEKPSNFFAISSIYVTYSLKRTVVLLKLFANSPSSSLVEQAGAVEKLAVTISEVSEVVQKNAKGAKKANEISQSVEKSILESNEKMQIQRLL